jgi:hypothetical protein
VIGNLLPGGGHEENRKLQLAHFPTLFIKIVMLLWTLLGN